MEKDDVSSEINCFTDVKAGLEDEDIVDVNSTE
jgi:hypothetical protein